MGTGDTEGMGRAPGAACTAARRTVRVVEACLRDMEPPVEPARRTVRD